ncbi:MAG TPA: hypothetical protein VN445_11670 [Rectinemataceae bacterium]|nr:hypothetical protein [Rectinemataceae bacterium]
MADENENEVKGRGDKERLARIEVEISHLKEDIGEIYRYLREEFAKMISIQIEDLRDKQKNLEKRVTSLEKWIWRAVGALAILSLLAPYILSQLGLVAK